MADNIENKIKKEWVTQAMSGLKSVEDDKISEETLNEEVVILIQGNNMFGDEIYSYVKVPLRNFKELRVAMLKGEDFKPSDYGDVVAAGRGTPTAEIKDEMRMQYNLVDVTQQMKQVKPIRPVAVPSQPHFFGDDDD